MKNRNAKLVERLKELKLWLPETYDVQLLAPPEALVQLQITVNLTQAQWDALKEFWKD